MPSTTADRARAHGAHHRARLADLVQQLGDAFREFARTVARTVARIVTRTVRATRALADQTTVRRAPDRPAHVSPYGPPPRGRHRRH
ncbi:hypothetical protein [Streptomyces sp. NBC_00425]|uniref:hypothetical protein n=1 Tax=Streptomyces sp. NBC_00425 TaxID=2975740 RepID=UPI002E213307